MLNKNSLCGFAKGLLNDKVKHFSTNNFITPKMNRFLFNKWYNLIYTDKNNTY